MRKITPRKNQYGHTVVDCPFCDGWVYFRPSTKSSPDPLRDLKRHITNEAKKEALAWYLAQESIPSPHMEYYKEHTAPAQVIVEGKRMYDQDLTI